jgi:hypothetical protein
MKTKIIEENLYKPVKDFFEDLGYVVRSEVNHCDLTAVKGDELIIVELKKGFTVDLVIQAVKRQRLTDLVYMAVPRPAKLVYTKKWNDICHLAKRLELGLILVSLKKGHEKVEALIHPQPFDRARSMQRYKKRRINLVKEIRERTKDYNTGGSTGKKLMTAYREKALYIACCLNLYGTMNVRQLKKLGTDSKKTSPILLQNHYGWFDRVEKGLYRLSNEGLKALTIYEELAQEYISSIKLLQL